MISNWTIFLVCALVFFMLRGLVKGYHRRNRILPGDTNIPRDASIAALAFADFSWNATHGHDGADFGGGMDAGAFGGGDMGGGAMGGGA